MPRQTFTGTEGPSGGPPTSHASVVNTVTRTVLWNPQLWTPIPAFSMQAGNTYRLTAFGVLSTTGAPTLIWQVCFGSSTTPGSNTTFGASTTAAMPTTVTNVPWFLDFIMQVRSVGLAASGSTVVGVGSVQIGGAAGAASTDLAFGGTVLTTADDKTQQGVSGDVTWGTASASNTITTQGSLLRSLN